MGSGREIILTKLSLQACRSRSIPVVARNAVVRRFLVHMPAADVQCESVKQTPRQTFASKFFSTDRTAGILPLENANSQGGFIL